jgi:uncharacterized cysteine cluster protein YcgN (CxxCxxCC family)
MGALSNPAPARNPKFWERPLATLDRAEWEALCDGCGKCCLHKLEDEDTGAFYETNVACKLLDLQTARCKDYKHRRAFVPDCVRLTPQLVADLPWLPETCAYRLRGADKPLPEWHYLISGDPEAVHRAGASVVGKAISEEFAGPLEQHVVLPEGLEWDGYTASDDDD